MLKIAGNNMNFFIKQYRSLLRQRKHYSRPENWVFSDKEHLPDIPNSQLDLEDFHMSFELDWEGVDPGAIVELDSPSPVQPDFQFEFDDPPPCESEDSNGPSLCWSLRLKHHLLKWIRCLNNQFRYYLLIPSYSHLQILKMY